MTSWKRGAILEPPEPDASLVRRLGLLGLAATGICSMMGGAINILPIALQRNVPGIGPHVLAAYALGAVPAVLAALAYAILGSAMPQAREHDGHVRRVEPPVDPAATWRATSSSASTSW
jgi:hypothetical protein